MHVCTSVYNARVVVKSLTPKNQIAKGRVLVHYIDFGDEEWLPKRRIFPLPSPFTAVPPMALVCSLAYIEPMRPQAKQSAEQTGVNDSNNEKQPIHCGGDRAINNEHSYDLKSAVPELVIKTEECKDSLKGAHEADNDDGWSTAATERFKLLAGNEKTLSMHMVQGNIADQKIR